VLFCSLIFITGCGNVGDPLPPLIQIPKRIADLTGIQLGKHIKLSWTLPKQNTDESEATTLSRIEIYRWRSRSAFSSTLDPTQFAQSAMKWMVLDKVNFEAYREGERMVLTDRLQGLADEEIFQSYFDYAIKVLNNKKQDAGFSNLISLRVLPVPNSPEGIRFSFTEQFIQLNWQSPTRNIDGSTVREDLKYNVYRSLVSEARVRDRLTITPIAELSFNDTSMVLGQTYYYVVRSVINSPEGPIESFDSQEYEARNVDTYPPKIPTEVTAISNGQSISIVWLPNTESDLSGYYVYRSGEERTYKKLTEQIITTASFIDASVEKGKTYYYRVKASDKSGNESGYSEEASDTVE
jgi:hypothetical protein